MLAASGPSSLTPAELTARRRDRPGVLLDVRTPGEFATGHVDGSANMDVMAPGFSTSVDALGREETYYLYCRSGQRSGHAAQVMRAMGFADVHNAGGFDALAAAGHPVAGAGDSR